MKSGLRIGIAALVLILLLSILSCQSIVTSFKDRELNEVSKAELILPTHQVELS